MFERKLDCLVHYQTWYKLTTIVYAYLVVCRYEKKIHFLKANLNFDHMINNCINDLKLMFLHPVA